MYRSGTLFDSVGEYTYDGSDQISEIRREDGKVVQYTFDLMGNMTSIRPPERQAYVFTYSSDNLLNNIAAPAANPIIYNYAPRTRELSSIVRPDGKVVMYQRDFGGRISTLQAPDVAVSYVYNDVSGNVQDIVASNGITTNMEYVGELLSAVSSTTPFFSSRMRYIRNELFDTTEEQLFVGQTGSPVKFSHDGDGLVTGDERMEINRDKESGLVTETRLGMLAGYSAYNMFGEVLGTSNRFNQNEYYTVSYSRDGGGRIVTKTESLLGEVWTYGYHFDEVGKLVSIDRNGLPFATYVFDANGNRLSRTGLGATVEGIYNGLDQVVSYGQFAYTYTENGELLTKNDSTTNETWGYLYDSFGNLVEIKKPDGTKIEYVTDGNQRRVAKKVNGNFVEGYVYGIDMQLLADVASNGQLRNRFVYASGSRMPDYFVRNDGKTYRILTDHLGSVRLVVDSLTGSVAQRIDYDEFGNVTLDTHPGFQPFGYAGGLYDPDTGLVRFGARDYDPYTGRWTAKDPILFDGGDTNLYGYVLNDPINGIDPDGLAPVCPDAPPGASMAKNMSQASSMCTVSWVNKVRPHGEWDYKRKSGSAYEDFGNFNYGATGKAQGFSDSTIMRAPGAVQMVDGGAYHANQGVPWGSSPYGDAPEDQEQIQSGIDYYYSIKEQDCKCSVPRN